MSSIPKIPPAEGANRIVLEAPCEITVSLPCPTCEEPPGPPMIEIPLNIASTGRLVVLLVPVDLSEHELRELAAWSLVSMLDHIAERTQPASGLVVVRGRLPT